jgi:hypothetical protein
MINIVPRVPVCQWLLTRPQHLEDAASLHVPLCRLKGMSGDESCQHMASPQCMQMPVITDAMQLCVLQLASRTFDANYFSSRKVDLEKQVGLPAVPPGSDSDRVLTHH